MRYGLSGWASTNSPGAGVSGWDVGNANAYAGYFTGNVKILTGGAGPNTNLTLENGVSLITNRICLSGVCRIDWPTGGAGDSYWSQNEIDTYITNTLSNLMAGGTSESNTPFYLKVTNKGSMIIGRPTDLSNPLDRLYSCGDGACNNGETNATCTQDCPPGFTVQPSATAGTNGANIAWAADESHFVKVQYDTDISDGQYGSSADPPGQPKNSYNYSLSGLESGTTYHYRVVIWDVYGNYNYSGDKQFTTLASGCGNAVCAYPTETCSNCPADCLVYSRGSAGGCSGTNMCCLSGLCQACCTTSSTTQCGSGNVCCQGQCYPGQCCFHSGLFECGPGNICCNKNCYPGECCTKDDCFGGMLCCSDGVCRSACKSGERNYPAPVIGE